MYANICTNYNNTVMTEYAVYRYCSVICIDLNAAAAICFGQLFVYNCILFERDREKLLR